MEGFRCESCACTLKTKQAYENHQKTNRHLLKDQMRNGTITHAHACKKCNKVFAFQSGLSRHSKTCTSTPSTDPAMVTMMTRMMKKLDQVEETNGKLLATIESMKTQIGPSNTTNNTTTTNNHITVQELKIFLNTECKDAKPILDFIETINLTLNEQCELELTNYNTTVTKIWKRNYLALPKHERPLYCVPTAESECTVFAKGDDTWQEQKEVEFMTKLEIKPKDVKDMMLATTAVHETCSKICELYEETLVDDDVVTMLTPKTKGPDREEWNQRKAHIWHEACKLDAELREKEGVLSV
jgi:hypothetical protein